MYIFIHDTCPKISGSCSNASRQASLMHSLGTILTGTSTRLYLKSSKFIQEKIGIRDAKPKYTGKTRKAKEMV